MKVATRLKVVDRDEAGKSPRASMFVRVPFDVFDSYMAAVVPPRLLVTYLAMRCFVLRTEGKTTQRTRALIRAGNLPVRLRQRRLAELLGVTRQTVNVLVSEMVDLGWVQAVDDHAGCVRLYLLGRRDESGAEYFFFDQQARELETRIRTGGASDFTTSDCCVGPAR